MNCTPRYLVDYAYVRGMLIMHKPWNKHNTLEHILNNKTATIDTFLRMIDRKEVPSSVTFQYLTAMKYARLKKLKHLLRKVSTIQISTKRILTWGEAPIGLFIKKKQKMKYRNKKSGKEYVSFKI